MYLDGTWVNQDHCTDYMWLPSDGSDAPKIPSGKGKRLFVLHTGTRNDNDIFFISFVFTIKDRSAIYLVKK